MSDDGGEAGWWSRSAGRRQPVPPDVLRWVERVTGRRVVAPRRLHGGLTSIVHDLTMDGGDHVVLRRYLPGSPDGDQWTASAVVREAANLDAVTASGIPAPVHLAHTTANDDLGSSCLLMTRVEGRVHLRPPDLDEWLRQLAGVLARIHASGIEAPPWQSWMRPDDLEMPPTAVDAGVWQRAHAVVRSHAPADAETAADHVTFIHRDFQHFNVLWRRARLAAVIDWEGASTGPPDIDVGHCRLNLSVLFGTEAAERFRLAYEAESDRTVDPRWDVHALLSYSEDWKRFIPLQVAGRATLETQHMTDRVEATIAGALDRLG